MSPSSVYSLRRFRIAKVSRAKRIWFLMYGFSAILTTYMESLIAMLELLLPRFEAEGKSYLTIAIGCTGGKHRSVYVSELLGEWIEQMGKRVQLHHRDLESQMHTENG